MSAGDVSSWRTTPNTSWVSTPLADTFHPSDEIPLVYSTTFPYTGYPTGATPVQTIATIVYRDGFLGEYQAARGFLGALPGNVPAAVLCTWNHARRGAYGGQWWTSDLGPDGSTGTGVCAPITGPVDSTTTDRDIGIWASSSAVDAGGHQEVSFAVRCLLMRLNVSELLSKFGPDAGAGLPGDNPFEQADIEWEDDRPELLGIDLVPDESSGANPESYAVTWYVDVPPNPESGGTQWGPSLETGTFTGASDGPEGYVGGLSPVMTLPYSGHVSAAWTQIDPAMVTAARAREVATGGEPGIRAVCIMPKMLASTLPFAFAGVGVDAAEYRTRQVLGLRIRMTPARHRWIDTSEEPPPIFLGSGDIVRSSSNLLAGH